MPIRMVLKEIHLGIRIKLPVEGRGYDARARRRPFPTRLAALIEGEIHHHSAGVQAFRPRVTGINHAIHFSVRECGYLRSQRIGKLRERDDFPDVRKSNMGAACVARRQAREFRARSVDGAPRVWLEQLQYMVAERARSALERLCNKAINDTAHHGSRDSIPAIMRIAPGAA